MRKLLIVDDVKVNRTILRKILGDSYDVLKASQGQEALDLMKQHSQDLSAVLLDLVMPVMDGFQVLSGMQEDPVLSKIPVIVMTGKTEEDAEVKALKLGANDFIAKPYNATIVKQRLWNVIHLRETAAEVNELQRDRLTGLYSRNTFFEKAEAMIRSEEPGYYVMCCFNVDNFKVINDQYGTRKGDSVLRMIADIFGKGMEPLGGLVRRMMADDYAVLYPSSCIDSEEIKAMRRKASVLDGSIPPLTFSIGRYIVDDLSLSVSAMYDRAALAEDTVKGRYDVNAAMFEPSMRDNLLAEQQIVTEMNHALETGQFENWYQPQYNHATGELMGAEVLVRWRHPEKGLISPAVFIPVFERNGFIYELDQYVWEKTCQALSRWIQEDRNPNPVSVNISRCDVTKKDLPDILTGLIQKYSIPIHLLRLEITESAFSSGNDQVVLAVRNLIDLGFTIEIDDFGSGYSSLNTLKDIPAQIIKLDMKFLESSENTQRGGNIIESVVRMVKWLDMSVIAEGVETVAQADYLKSIGCFCIQGYLYAKPMPQEQYEQLASVSQKHAEMDGLETVKHLDSNAFWNPDSMDTMMFNSYLGGACILEYYHGKVELLRANDRYIQVIGSAGITMQVALKLSWTDYMEPASREGMAEIASDRNETGKEFTFEFVFLDLPGCGKKTYLRCNLRIIARIGERCLIYCTSENSTAQRLAEQKKQETMEQLTFLENTAHELLAQPDPEAGIQEILRRLMDFFEGDRVYVFEFDLVKECSSNTYELCAEGITSEKHRLQNIPFELNSFWMHAFDAQNYVDIEDVDSLDESRKEERELLQIQNIQSLVAVPLRYNGKLIGFVGVDNPRQKHAQIDRISALGDYISVLLERRDQNEEINHENQEKLDIMDGIPGGFVRMQALPDGTIIPLYESEGFKNLVHMSQEEIDILYSTNVLNGVHPDDVQTVEEALNEMLEHGEVHNACYRLTKGSGGYVWVSIFGKSRKSRNGEIFLNVYYSDAADIIRSEKVQNDLLDNLPCGAAMYEWKDHQLHVVHLNRRYWELVGRSPEEGKKISIMDAVHPEDRKILEKEISAAEKENRTAVCNLRILYGKSDYHLFHVTGKIIHQADGRILLYVSYIPLNSAGGVTQMSGWRKK